MSFAKMSFAKTSLAKLSLAKIFPGLVVLLLVGAVSPAGAAAQHVAHAPTVMRRPALVTPTDFSASRRRHAHRMRHATRIHIYRRGDYSFFEPYAPPVPLFFPFGYRQGYF